MMPKNAYRPFVETLESRLQPGSLLLSSGYASPLADNLSLLNPQPSDSHRLAAPSSQSSAPTFTSPVVDLHSDHLDLAAASVTAARNENPGTPTNDLVNHLDSSLLTD